MEDNNAPEAPTPCTAGCGFYGNKIYNNMCSKCFKEQDDRNKSESNLLPLDNQPIITKEIQQEQQPSIPVAAETKVEPVAEATVVVVNEPVVQEPVEEEKKEPSKAIQKNKGRCFSCRTKIPLAKQLTNKCRCEYVFCDTHRYPDKHDCNFDHAQNDKDILLKNNPKLHDKPRGGNSFNRLDSI